MQGLDKAAALLGAGFFQDGPARNHDVATAAIHFEDLERLGDVHERCYVEHRTNIDLAAGKESDGAVQIDSEAALDAAEDHAFYACALGKFGFKLVPCGFAASAVARQHGFATDRKSTRLNSSH